MLIQMPFGISFPLFPSQFIKSPFFSPTEVHLMVTAISMATPLTLSSWSTIRASSSTLNGTSRPIKASRISQPKRLVNLLALIQTTPHATFSMPLNAVIILLGLFISKSWTLKMPKSIASILSTLPKFGHTRYKQSVVLYHKFFSHTQNSSSGLSSSTCGQTYIEP